MNKRQLLFVVAVASIGVWTPAFAQTADAIEQLVNASKILPAEYKIRAYVRGPEATIVTYRNTKATDQDCKIDAILIAQKIMDANKSIAAVRTQFCYIDKPAQYDQVEIHAGDVKAFGAGGMSKQRLLESLPISKSGPAKKGFVDTTQFQLTLKNFKCAPGYGLELREKILSLLREIVAKGGDATEYWQEFKSIDNKVKSGLDREITDECNSLHNRVYKTYTETLSNSVKRQTAQLAQVNAITSANAVAKFEPRPGPMYAQRLRLTKQIALKALAGEDVKWYQTMLIKHIEKYARENDMAHLSRAISELEIQMHLAPM